MPCGIYRIGNTVTNKVYVGQSSDIYQRWRQHRHLLDTHRHSNRYLQSAWNKHGQSSFTFEIVLECHEDTLEANEVQELDKVPAALRYNLGPAGACPTLGIQKTEDQKLRVSRGGGGRPFFARNRTTGELLRFEHTGEAEKLGFSQSKMSLCLNGLHPSHKDHVFFYDPEVPAVVKVPKPKGQVERRNRRIIGTNLVTGEELRFEYASEVSGKGFTRTGVYKCLSGEMHQHKGHTWRYEDGLPHVQMSEESKARLRGARAALGGSRPVYGIHLVTGARLDLDYVGQVRHVLGKPPALVHNCLAGYPKSAYGYTWHYADEEKKEGGQ